MSKEYIPVATSDTIYYEPLTEQEMEETFEVMKVGDMIFNKWTFQASGGMWYTMGLMDRSRPDTKMLFPNILMDDMKVSAISKYEKKNCRIFFEHRCKHIFVFLGFMLSYSKFLCYNRIIVRLFLLRNYQSYAR